MNFEEKLKSLLKTENSKEDSLQINIINKLKLESKDSKIQGRSSSILKNAHINIDSIITFIFLKKLMTPFSQTKAYTLGLIDKSGKVIKVAQTEDEKDSLTILDKLIFKIKRLLGGKLLNLNKFFYLKTLNIDMYQKLMIKGNVEQRAEIIRITKDIQNLQEKYNLSLEDLLSVVLNENLEEHLNEF